MAFAFRYKGQVYRYVGDVQHTRLDGIDVWLHVLDTDCPDCGAPFSLKQTIPVAMERLTRRCSACKKPGVKVNQ